MTHRKARATRVRHIKRPPPAAYKQLEPAPITLCGPEWSWPKKLWGRI